MAIQPLDFQVNIAQQTNVSNLQQAAQQAPIDSQHHADKKAVEKARIQQTKVEAANQPESEKVEPEGKRGSGYSPGERKKKEEEEEGKKEDLPKDPTKGRLIDVLK